MAMATSNAAPPTRSRVLTSIPYRYTPRVTTQVPTRFPDDELVALDALVADGVARSRSEAIRLAVERLVDAHRRERIGQAIAAAYEDRPQTPEEDELALASAIALVEAESW
jgi:Arc/MetJ-type ribon-helix-helix transcriptional regulator